MFLPDKILPINYLNNILNYYCVLLLQIMLDELVYIYNIRMSIKEF